MEEFKINDNVKGVMSEPLILGVKGKIIGFCEDGYLKIEGFDGCEWCPLEFEKID